jgi:S1-C subfamily serine protease
MVGSAGLARRAKDLQPGDVLIKAGGRDLRSSASLYAAVRAAGTSPVQLTVLRGNDRFQTSLQLSGPVDGRSAAARGPGRAGHTV